MTDAELAILSIVAEGPIHGYDIQTLIIRRGLRVWTNIGVSSMYYVLEKLQRQGLIESMGGSPTDGASRREYSITPAGSGVLQTAVADLLSTPRSGADSFELGLANLHVLRPSQVRTALTAYRQGLVALLAQARERWDQLKVHRAPLHVDAMVGHQVAALEAELAWVTAFAEAWERQAPAETPPAAPEPAAIPRMKQVVLPHDPDSPHRAPTALHPDPAPAPSEASRRETKLNARTPPRLPPLPEPPPEDGKAD
jgi:DNA-binding PadR family transcriptional regulator